MNDLAQYTKQINVVLDYINTHIDEKLDIQLLAHQTNLSVYHFHRIFTSVMGEPLAKYIMRKRLEQAAIQLQNDLQKPVTDIALEYGFNSVNVFCRNFKKHFGITAETYRNKIRQKDSKNRTLEHIISQQSRSYSHYFCQRKTLKIGDKFMICNFEIKHLSAIHVVYCRHYGTYTTMQKSFEKLLHWAYPKGLVTTEEFHLASIYHDDPNITTEEKRISDACLIVKNPVKTDGEISAYTIPVGQYAVGHFEILWDEFQTSWECMFRLIDEHGCRCCGLPFEVYLNNYETHPEKKWIVDICIPVVSK